MTHLYGPAVRCKPNWINGGGWSCASVSGPCMERLCSWPSWISARTRSHSRKGPERPLGSPDHRYDACFVATSLNQDGQSDPRQLVGKRDGQNVAMQTPRRSREPGSKTVLCPTLRSEQNGAGALDEEHTQIAVSALRDAAKDRAITGRHLFRHQAKPSGKVSPFRKGSSMPTAATVAL